MHSQAVRLSVYTPRWAPLGHIKSWLSSKKTEQVKGHTCSAMQVLIIPNNEFYYFICQGTHKNI